MARASWSVYFTQRLRDAIHNSSNGGRGVVYSRDVTDDEVTQFMPKQVDGRFIGEYGIDREDDKIQVVSRSGKWSIEIVTINAEEPDVDEE